MRVFYAVFVADRHIEQLLDAIRLLGNPAEKHAAHITLRGPYTQRYRMDLKNRVVQGATVRVSGVNAFWGPRQNTIFLKCDAPELRAVWHKPDYPDYQPHLTLYDGPSRSFAERLLDRLLHCEPIFEFHATELRPLGSSKGQVTLDLAASLDGPLLSRLAGDNFVPEFIHTMNETTRLGWVARFCECLSDRGSSCTEGEERTGTRAATTLRIIRRSSSPTLLSEPSSRQLGFV